MTELHALLERCQSVQWPDREIDGRVWLAATHPEMKAFHDGVMLRYSKDGHPPFEYQHDTNIPHYSGSLDAASALVAKILPGWTYAIDATAPEAGIDCELFGPAEERIKGIGNTEPLARLAALLKVLIAKASSHGGEG